MPRRAGGCGSTRSAGRPWTGSPSGSTYKPIDRPRIHEFAGALLGKQGDRGVFITTSRFTTGARQEAERINARIELIDGARLARLLVDYGVGVQGEQTVTLYRIDEDFFDGL
jgi:restriction system protein